MKLRIALLGILVLAVCSSPAKDGWTFYEETNVKGSISGTIKKGSIIEMQSGSIYEVWGITIQLVLELSPDAHVLTNGTLFKLIIDGFDDPLICRQLAAPAHIASNATEKSESAVSPPASNPPNIPMDKLMSKSQQRRMGIHKLNKHERERLRVFLIELYFRGVEQGKKLSLTQKPDTKVDSPTPSVVKSKINGDFEGWEGETIVKLMNGQIWQQTEYRYHYHYSFMPNVLIFKSGIGYKMKVEGIDGAVGVKRLR